MDEFQTQSLCWGTVVYSGESTAERWMGCENLVSFAGWCWGWMTRTRCVGG